MPYFDDGPRLDLGAALSRAVSKAAAAAAAVVAAALAAAAAAAFGDADDDGVAIPRGELVNAIWVDPRECPSRLGWRLSSCTGTREHHQDLPPLNAEETAGGDNLVIYTAAKWHKQIGDLLDVPIQAIEINMEAGAERLNRLVRRSQHRSGHVLQHQ